MGFIFCDQFFIFTSKNVRRRTLERVMNVSYSHKKNSITDITENDFVATNEFVKALILL